MTRNQYRLTVAIALTGTRERTATMTTRHYYVGFAFGWVSGFLLGMGVVAEGWVHL